MSFKFDENLIASIISSFKHMSYLSHQSVIAIETNESLSVSGQKHLNSLRFCALQASRLCNMMNYLMDPDTRETEKRTENFEIEDILNGIVSTFCQTLSAYMPITSKCTINLNSSTSILLDKSRFELIFLNLLYCCVKKRTNRKTPNLRLLVSVTENKENVVFHIRDNSSNLNHQIIDAVFSPSPSKLKISATGSFDSLILLSLKVAYKSALQMGAGLSYAPLKSGNRFDICVPKAPAHADTRACSPKVYSPDDRRYHEILASFILEDIEQYPGKIFVTEGGFDHDFANDRG